MEVFREFRFESAHWLPNVPADHKCRRLHGHSFRVDVHVCGEIDSELGWIVDFGDIDTAFAPIHEAVDHRCLNEVAGLENPTSEHLAQWIWQRLAPRPRPASASSSASASRRPGAGPARRVT